MITAGVSAMTTMQSERLMTTQDLLALPEDGMERELSRGKLREREMTRRGRRHTKAGTAIARLLANWLVSQPMPRGEVLTGEAGFQLQSEPDTTVGIDVAYISAELAQSSPEDAFIIEGVPTLAVEILSPSDQQQDVLDKVRDYLDAGVPVVWIVETVFKTVTVYGPGSEPRMFTVKDELTAEPHLPGLRIRVAQVFE
jgi:Uma2 family endonuclease